jgi:hypothetical protein
LGVVVDEAGEDTGLPWDCARRRLALGRGLGLLPLSEDDERLLSKSGGLLWSEE